MAFDKLSCPKCSSVLKPARPVDEGKKVKCPKCAFVFPAGPETAVNGDGKKTDVAKKAEQPKQATQQAAEGKKPSAMDDEDDGPKTYGLAEETPSPALEKPKKVKKEDEDDEDEDEDEDEEEEEKDDILDQYLKHKEVKDPRGPATEKVTWVSNWLIITYGILAFLHIAAIAFWYFPFVFAEHLLEPADLRVVGEDQDLEGLPVERIRTNDQGVEVKSSVFLHRLGKYPYFADKDNKAVKPDKTWAELKEAADKGDNSKETIKSQLDLDNLREFQTYYGNERIYLSVYNLLLLPYCVLIVYGAVQMQNLSSYGWSWASAIMAILPIGWLLCVCRGIYWPVYAMTPDLIKDDIDELMCCGVWWAIVAVMVLTNVWTLVLGIMSLIPMLDPQVKNAFYYVED